MEKKFLCQLRDTYRAIAQIDMQMQQLFGLNLNEAMTLCTLRDGDISSGNLAQTLGITPSSASKIIKRMEELGFIARRLSSEDRRSMVISLTAKGLNKLESIACDKIVIPNTLTINDRPFYSQKTQ